MVDVNYSTSELIEARAVNGEQDSFEVYLNNINRGFFFRVEGSDSWLAQLNYRDMPAFLCGGFAPALAWLTGKLLP